MVAPALAPGAAAVEAYFPAGLWYGLWDNRTVDTRQDAATR